MTDVLDRKIRGLVAELVDAAPVPPALGPFASPGFRRSPRRAVRAAAVAACLVAVSAVLLAVDEEESRVDFDALPTEAPPSETAVKPTFVVPAQLPARLELADAGSGESGLVGTHEMLFWSDDFVRGGAILWGRVNGGCSTVVAPGSSVATSQEKAIDAYRSGRGPAGHAGAVQWCDAADEVIVTVSPRPGMSREETASVAEGIVREGDDLAVTLPPGLRAVRTPETIERIRLRYLSRGSEAGELWVDVQSAGPFPLERQRLTSVSPASWEPATVGGRPAVKGDRVVAVLYDDHTLVVLSSASMAEDDLLAAAASLVPGDPSLPKPVASDSALCDRLGMCG